MLLKLRQDLEAAGVCVIFPKVKQATLSSVLEQCCRCVGLNLHDARANEPERALSDFLQTQRAAGKAVAVLIDDAHLLQPASLLGIWDLVHVATGARSATSLVLAGHGDLDARLRSSELSKMKKAVVDRIALKPLESQQVGPFVRHRLRIAGYTGPDLFTDEAIGRIAEYANGIPSLINLICGLSLKFARVVSEATVSADAVEDMQKFLGRGGPSASSARPHTLETESIKRLQRLYDLISSPYVDDGGTSPPELDPPGHLPQPARDETFSERDLMKAISNALDWQPMAIEEEHADDALTANRARSWAAGAVAPIAAGVALIALIAGGAAFFYRQETTSHTVSLTELKSPPEARAPNSDIASIEKFLGEGPVEKSAPTDMWQPTRTKGTQSGELPTTSDGRIGMEPMPDSGRSPPSTLIEPSLAAVADPPLLEVADATGAEGAEVALSVAARPAEDAGEA
jgi:type II secretory pathway predicted ATPase ExeA